MNRIQQRPAEQTRSSGGKSILWDSPPKRPLPRMCRPRCAGCGSEIGVEECKCHIADHNATMVVVWLVAIMALAFALGFGAGKARGADPVPDPPGSLGCVHLMSDARPDNWPVTNRGVWRVDPLRVDGKKVFANYLDYFAFRVDPITAWLEGGATKRSARHDFERPFGSVGAWRLEWTVADGLEAQAEGKTWLEDFVQAALPHTKSGRQIVCHMGGLELGNWAGNVRRQRTPEATADALATVFRTYEPLIRAGVVIGVDAASASDESSADYGAVTLVRALGGEAQIESSFPFTAKHWRGTPCRLAYGNEFLWRHVTQDATSASMYPKLGTPEFRAQYAAEIRVSLFGGTLGTADARFYENSVKAPDGKRRALLDIVAAKSRELIEGGCVVLLDAETIEQAIELKVPAKEFLPPESRLDMLRMPPELRTRGLELCLAA